MPIPIPDKTLVPKKAQWFLTAIWIIAPAMTMLDPMPTQILRPNLSAIYEAGAKETKAPTEVAAMIRPTIFGSRPPIIVPTIS